MAFSNSCLLLFSYFLFTFLTSDLLTLFFIFFISWLFPFLIGFLHFFDIIVFFCTLCIDHLVFFVPNLLALLMTVSNKKQITEYSCSRLTRRADLWPQALRRLLLKSRRKTIPLTSKLRLLFALILQTERGIIVASN